MVQTGTSSGGGGFGQGGSRGQGGSSGGGFGGGGVGGGVPPTNTTDQTSGGGGPSPPPAFGTGKSQLELDFEAAVADFDRKLVGYRTDILDAQRQLSRLRLSRVSDQKTIKELQERIVDLTAKAQAASGMFDGSLLVSAIHSINANVAVLDTQFSGLRFESTAADTDLFGSGFQYELEQKRALVLSLSADVSARDSRLVRARDNWLRDKITVSLYYGKLTQLAGLWEAFTSQIESTLTQSAPIGLVVQRALGQVRDLQASFRSWSVPATSPPWIEPGPHDPSVV